MIEFLKKYTNDFFGVLLFKFGFEKKEESISEDFYFIEYITKNYSIKIEKYHREFYPTTYFLSDADNEVNLFNLLGYLKQEESNIPKSNFFKKEKDLQECYKKQLKYISETLNDNLGLLDNFFSKKNYEENMRLFHLYWKGKHPELYTTK